ncbi:MAG: SGNH/GDSL hydrolase family protein [Nannocystis sp.]|nr:SGNH/GDSL hydrolase family protein [Nannocystis sp.]
MLAVILRRLAPALVAAAAFTRAGPLAAEEPLTPPAAEEPPEPANWAFKDPSRPVKVVVLAGSIGAWPRLPYAERLAQLCRNAEVKNLSKTGYGALQLKQRFRQQVLDNHRLNFRTGEYWLVFQGGLNSVGMPESTNHHMRELYLLAHRRGLKVVGLTLTPWGDEGDRQRWGGAQGLRYFRFTRTIVDYVLGALSPREALGEHAGRRPGGADAPWDPAELPDIAVDLYRAPYLRAADAPLRDREKLRRELERDPAWRRALAGLSDDERAARLDAEASLAAELPRWFLRAELRSFDHIHPNAEGHRRIAELVCPSLPDSWGCTCPELPAGASAAAAAADTPPPPTSDAVDQVLLPFYPPWIRELLRILHGAP